MARLLALCSLPRTNPKNRHEFKRVNGPYTLYMVAGGGNKLPYGTLPRLLLAWVCTEAVRTQSPELILGDSLSAFMRKVGIYSTSGDKHTRLRNQMRRLFGCTVCSAPGFLDSGGQGDRTPSVEESVCLPSAGPRGECLLPVQVDLWGCASGSQSSGAGSRSTRRVQRLESDDRPGKARLVRHRSVRARGWGIVAGQNLFMQQRRYSSGSGVPAAFTVSVTASTASPSA